MTTYSRIATAISHLLAVSTVDDTARAEVEAVVEELHQTESSFQSQIDALTKRLSTLEGEEATTEAGIAAVADAADPQPALADGAEEAAPTAVESPLAGDAEAPAGETGAVTSTVEGGFSDSSTAVTGDEAPAAEGIAPSPVEADAAAPAAEDPNAEPATADTPASGSGEDTVAPAAEGDTLAGGQSGDEIFG